MFKVSVMYPNQEGARFDIDNVTPIRQVSEIIAAS